MGVGAATQTGGTGDASAILEMPGQTAWVHDPLHGLINIVTGSGVLGSYSLARRDFLADLSVGGTPNTIDVSADGRFLVIGHNDITRTTTPATATLTRVTIDTQGLTTIPIPLSSTSQKGILDLVTGVDGNAVFNRQSGQTGVNPYQQVRLTDGSPTPQAVSALANQGFFNALVRSDDHRYITVQQGGITGTPLSLYDTQTGRFVAPVNTGGGGPLGHGDVSSAAGMVVAVQYDSIGAYDLNLRLVKILSGYQSSGSTVGATFTDDGHHLLLWRAPNAFFFGGASSIVVLDTQTWRQVGTVTPTLSTPYSPGTTSSLGRMDIAGGQVLVMDQGTRLELVDLGARMKLVVTGDGADEALWGSVGQDSLTAGGGRDTLSGGRGADTLSGGAGADIFGLLAGDSAPAGPIDVITDWEAGDRLTFGRSPASAATYAEGGADTFAAARLFADQQIAAGVIDYVAVSVGADVFVFADSRGDNGGADDVVRLAGRGLGDIAAEAIQGAATPLSTGGSALPALPALPTGTSRATVTGDTDAAHLSTLLPARIIQADESNVTLSTPFGFALVVTGTGFTYVNDQLVGGTVRSISFSNFPPGSSTASARFGAQGFTLDAGLLTPWLVNDATQTAFSTILAGSDLIGGGQGADLIRGYDGSDFVYGLGGGDTMYGGPGDDVLYVKLPPTVTFPSNVGAAGATYLRGDEGNDYIIGGDAFDDANGNMGADTISTGLGEDYCVGGKDNDLLFGDEGYDLVYGNLGADTCDGGDGNDIVRGGQDNDVVQGGNGADFVSGDKGDDTMTGGAGADIFHTFGDAALDRVVDFNPADGDRVQVDPGTVFTVSQAGADTVITMAGGGVMVLAGVQMSTLAPGWIFGA